MSVLSVLVSLCWQCCINCWISIHSHAWLLRGQVEYYLVRKSHWDQAVFLLKMAAESRSLLMLVYDFLRECGASTDIWLSEGATDFVRLWTSLAIPCVVKIIRLERRIGYIYVSHLIWLMHSDLFRWENTLGEWTDIGSSDRLCH